MRKIWMVGGCVLVLAACGDDEQRGSGIVSANVVTNNQVNNTTTPNSTTPNSTIVPNNAAESGYDATKILAIPLGVNPDDMPCQSESVVGNTTNLKRFGYTPEGALQVIDSYVNDEHRQRVLRRGDDDRIAEEVTVDVARTRTDLSKSFSYDTMDRLTRIEYRAVTDEMVGQTFEATQWNYTTNTTWGVSQLDDEGLMIDGVNYSWESGNARFNVFTSSDEVTRWTYSSAPGVERLHEWNVREQFETGGVISEGFIDTNDDGMADATISATYSPEPRTNLLNITISSAGNDRSIDYVYECE